MWLQVLPWALLGVSLCLIAILSGVVLRCQSERTMWQTAHDTAVKEVLKLRRLGK